MFWAIFPYQFEAPITRIPKGNYILIGICSFIFLLIKSNLLPDSAYDILVLYKFDSLGIVGHMFTHVNFWHFFFNMLYLWVIGNVICSYLGNTIYVLLFVIMGLLAGGVHLLFSDSPAIGASGAINGLIGISLLWFPVSKIRLLVVYFFFFMKMGVKTVVLSAFWLIIFWFIQDLWGAMSISESNIAYMAHIGGFLSGIILGALILSAKFVNLYDSTLIEIVTGRNKNTIYNSFDA